MRVVVGIECFVFLRPLEDTFSFSLDPVWNDPTLASHSTAEAENVRIFCFLRRRFRARISLRSTRFHRTRQLLIRGCFHPSLSVVFALNGIEGPPRTRKRHCVNSRRRDGVVKGWVPCFVFPWFIIFFISLAGGRFLSVGYVSLSLPIVLCVGIWIQPLSVFPCVCLCLYSCERRRFGVETDRPCMYFLKTCQSPERPTSRYPFV